MDLSRYLMILRDRLEEVEIDGTTIEKIIARERATMTGEPTNLLTIERLDILVASALARFEKEKNNVNKIDLKKNDAEQGSPILYNEDETVVVKKDSEEATRPIETEEKTRVPFDISIKKNILSETLEKTVQLPFSSDTTTVMISDESKFSFPEEKTLAVPESIEKLLSENATVRISEKDTVFFTVTDENEETTVHQYFSVKEKTDNMVSEAQKKISYEEDNATVPISILDISAPPTKVVSEIATPKENIAAEHPVLDDPMLSEMRNGGKSQRRMIISDKDLRNPHAKSSLFLLILLFFPTIIAVLAAIVLLFLLGNLVFMIALVAIMIVYFSLTLVPLLIAVYSIVFSAIYFTDGRTIDGFGELGMALISTALTLIFGGFLYKPFIKVTDFLLKKLVGFNKKLHLLLRNLYRYSLKGAEKL